MSLFGGSNHQLYVGAGPLNEGGVLAALSDRPALTQATPARS